MAPSALADTPKEASSILYAWVDGVSVRRNPSLSEKPFAGLEAGEAVVWSGKTSDEELEVTLRDESYKKPFYFVTLWNGEEGWVHGATLQNEPLKQHDDGVAYFTKGTFSDLDEWEEASGWECREKLLKEIAESEEKPTIRDQGRIARLIRSARCKTPGMKGPHFALVKQGKRARWVQVRLRWTLIVKEAGETCGSVSQLLYLRFEVAWSQTKIQGEPMLFRTGIPKSATSSLYEFGKKERRTRDLNEHFPEVQEARLKVEIMKACSDATGPCETEYQSVMNKSIELWMKFAGGKEVRVDQQLAESCYSIFPARLENVRVVDVNGDGSADLLYEYHTTGVGLVLFKNKAVYKRITLNQAQYSGIGGC